MDDDVKEQIDRINKKLESTLTIILEHFKETDERIEQIKFDHQKRLERAKKKLRPNPLRPDADPIDIDDLYGPQKMCLNCHK